MACKDYGLWPIKTIMTYGLWPVACGLWPVACDPAQGGLLARHAVASGL